MRAFRPIAAAVALLLPIAATAQVAAPPYRDTAGQLQSSTGVVVLNPDGSSSTPPVRATSTSSAGTVAAANAYQSALPASATRKGCALYNTGTTALLVYLGAPGAASAATSIPVPAGGAFNCGSFQGLVLTDQISVTSATVGAPFVVVSQ